MLKQITNEHGVTYWEVWDNNEFKGRIYRTSHPIAPFEAFTYDNCFSKRAMNLQESENFLLKD